MEIFFKKEITESADTFNLDKNIILAIIQQESAFNPYVIRYEPKWDYLFHVEQFSESLKISLCTEIQTQKISWGLGQLMGSVARELGFSQQMPILCDPSLNIHYTCKNIEAIKKKITIDGRVIVERIFSCYNGGYEAILRREKDGKFPNQGYVDSCLKHYFEFERINGD